jgi:Flp pilus assembly protein TadB
MAALITVLALASQRAVLGPLAATTTPILASSAAPTLSAWVMPGGLIACLLAGSALLLWPEPPPLVPDRAARRRSWIGGLRLPARARRGLLWVGAALAVGALVGSGPLTMIATAGVAVAAARWLPMAHPHRGRARLSGPSGQWPDAALVLDLLATALESGLPMPQAISAVTHADRSGAAAALREVGQLLMLGAPPAEAWQPVAADARLSAVATAAVRSALGGVTVADAAREAAVEIREAARVAAERSAARAEVAMTAPLALCFLPAFLCWGLAPVVIGLVAGLHLF